MQVELLDDAFLLPDLRSFLIAEGFLVATSDRPGALDVFAPDVSNPNAAAARVTACANAWAALWGVPIAIDPPADRIANPLGIDARRVSSGGGEPTVSIGLPVYNGARFIAETLDSLLQQTYADLELIICDNASNDGTRQICEAYAVRDERIRYLRSDVNRGAAWNYNRAVEAAVGRYFKWASHDDLCAPTYLERCVEVLDRAPDSVVLAYPKTALIDADGNLLGPYEDGLDLRQPEPHQRLRALIRNLVMSNAVFGLVRRDALNRTRGHGTYISADYVLLAELAVQGQFWEIPEQLFLRRDHPGMSRRANTSSAELAEWFKTGGHQNREFSRLLGEYLRALQQAPGLGPLERLRAYGTLLPWLRRFHRSILRELAAPLLRPSAAANASIAGHVSAASRVERLAVRESVRAAVWSIAPDYASQVRIHVDPQLTVDADRAALDRILLNLVSNAVRYGDGPITIAADVERDFVLTIEDRGRGISPSFLPRLFEPFSRSDESEHDSPGLGLGLAIARMSATASGGTLTSEPSDAGARFRLTLPGPGSEDRRERPGATRTTLRPNATRPGGPRLCVAGS